MMKRTVLVIFGSPRKVNSYNVTKRIEDELNKLGSYEFEYVFLSDLKLKICKGCHTCLFVDEEKCPLKDDSKKIYQKMLEAEGLVFVSPVYVMNVSALMKNFIDRMCFLCHRPELFGQDVLVVSTTGVIGLKRTLNYMDEVAEVWGAKSVTKLGITTPPKEDIFTEKNTSQIENTARAYHDEFDQQFSPSINQLIQFKMQKKIFTTDWAKEVSPADYKHYIKLEDKSFNIPVKVNPIKNFIAAVFCRFVSLFM